MSASDPRRTLKLDVVYVESVRSVSDAALIDQTRPHGILRPSTGTGFDANDGSSGDQVIPLAKLIDVLIPDQDPHALHKGDHSPSLVFPLVGRGKQDHLRSDKLVEIDKKHGLVRHGTKLSWRASAFHPQTTVRSRPIADIGAYQHCQTLMGSAYGRHT